MAHEESIETTDDPRPVTRWFPNAVLDLPPLEPVFALRTPHRICLQAMPSSRDVLQKLLQGPTFEVSVELDSSEAPLQHVPVHDVHEARLTPDLPLAWDHYYWIIDGLQEDLRLNAMDPALGLAAGRTRLAAMETVFRERRRGTTCELEDIERAFAEMTNPLANDSGSRTDPMQTLQQYVRGLSGHLIEHATSLAFSDWTADLLQEAEKQPSMTLPRLEKDDDALLGMYLQHRLFGNAWLTSPSGIVAGWHLLISSYVLSVWFAGLLIRAGYERELNEALFGSLWMIDQGFWRDETLLHDVLHNLNASEYTSFDLAMALTSAMREARVRA